jgi:hypothetical protein
MYRDNHTEHTHTHNMYRDNHTEHTHTICIVTIIRNTHTHTHTLFRQNAKCLALNKALPGYRYVLRD